MQIGEQKIIDSVNSPAKYSVQEIKFADRTFLLIGVATPLFPEKEIALETTDFVGFK